MKTSSLESITLCGAAVTIDWSGGSTADSIGSASHTVPSEDLEDGTADGPCDGYTFCLSGHDYRLGEHDYETADGQTTCTANVYAALTPEAR